MKQKQLIFAVSLMLMSSAFTFGQTTDNNFVSDQKSEIKKAARVESTKNQVSSKPAIHNEDGYMGRKEAFLKKLTVKELPADFPKYQDGTPAEEYKLMVRNWMKNHKDLVRPEIKQKLAAKRK